MESLADKLKSLGAKTGTSPSKAQTQPKVRFDIAEVVPGMDFETAFGNTFVVENDYPVESFVGNEHLFRPLNLETLGQWAKIEGLAERPLDEFVLLDTETSGLAGGTGTFVFLVGLGYRTANGFHLIQLFMRDPGQEPALLAGLAHFLASFKTVITFNGKSFDIPMLNSRHVMNGFTSPFAEFQHIDLLPLARRLWRNRLPSRALKDLETDILGLARTDDEVPGWMIPELYYEYLRSGDARPLGGVIYHNAQDILSLGLLFNYVADLLSNPLQVVPKQGLDLIAIARLYEDLNQWEQAVQLYEHSLDQGLPLPFFLDTLRRYANLYRKQERWDEAIQLWIKAAGYHQVEACVELAKHCEHRQRDYQGALNWVQTALGYVPEISPLPARREAQKDLEHRARRLEQKLGGGKEK
jgi:uncharacterized protein YprB with RNaseH-like and TPR domain